MMPPEGWTLPDGYSDPDPRPSRCRGCHAEILWAFSPKGARTPLDRDGINHFITCPDRDRFRRKKGSAG